MPLRDDLLNPIPGDVPSGANLRYDPVTDKIKEARREDLDVPQGDWKTALKTADYPAVIKMASDAIAKRGKDLQIAVWLVDALVRKEGFAVLAPSFQFLHDLLEQYWDTLYPPIDEDGDMEVRAAPLVWLGSKLGEPLGFLPIVSGKLNYHKYKESRAVGYEADAQYGEKEEARRTAVREGKITAEEFDAAADSTPIPALRETFKQLTEARAAVEALAEYCDMQFGGFSPSFIKTRDAVDEIAQTVRIILGRKPGGLEEEAPAKIEDDFSMMAVSPGVEETPVAVASFEPSAERPAEREQLGDVARQLAAICRTMRERNPEDPAPYMILRAFVWADVMYKAPMLDHSAIVAPESDLRVKMKRLNADSEWDKLLELTESTLLRPCGRHWLDLQRYAANAMAGKAGVMILKPVNEQLRIMLEAMPDVLDIVFPDDTPAANQETKDWIDNYVAHHRVSEMARPAPPADDSSSSETPSDLSFDTPPAEETPALDTSWDSTPAAEPTPEPEPAAALELEPFVLEELPPILEAEEPPPADTSDEFAMALKAVRDGQIVEGLGMITGILATERCGRQRFRRRTQLAHLLMAAGKGKVAQPLLDQLAAEIEERRLEEWEPSEAIAYPLELLMHCLTSADDERRAQLYARICKLDPVRALNCSV
jgi:type VI secretion system protein ImpA